MAVPRKRGRPRKENTTQLNKEAEQISATDSKEVVAKTSNAKTKKPAAKGKSMKSQGNMLFALDIGTRTVVGILGEEIDDIFYLRDYEIIPHTRRAMVDGQVEDIQQVAKIARQVKKNLENRNHIGLTEVSIAAAGRALKTCRTEMEFDISEKDILSDDMVKSMEIETILKAQSLLDEEYSNRDTLFYCVGHTVVQYKLDEYNMISLVGHKGKKVKMDIISAFLPSIVVEGLYAVMDEIGLNETSMTLEPIAAMNVIIPPEIRLINIALVDIGAGTSDIAIARDGSIVAYAMATVAGDEITEEIIRSFFVDFNTAESMKTSGSNGDETVNFKDIFGHSHRISSDELFETINSAVDNLAKTICETIVEANGKPPAAVFLIGGGSMSRGLAKLISQKLNVNEAHVVVGGDEFLKNVDIGKNLLGPEFVTPIGIGVTAALNQGYDFSVINLNGEKVRVFDTKLLSVFELLTVSGYKPSQIMGRSGRNLNYTFNGEKRTVKGSLLVPAEIFVNGKPAALTTKVTQGDSVKVIPAKNGENAKVILSEIVNPKCLTTGVIELFGQNYNIGLTAFVNGQAVDMSYEIQPLDEIEEKGIVTMQDLLDELNIEASDVDLTIDGESIPSDYILSDGDVISVNGGIPVNAALEPQESDSGNSPDEDVDAATETVEEETETTPPQDAEESLLSILLNGKVLELPERENKSNYLMVDMLNYADIDVENLSGKLVTILNGLHAKFTDVIQTGDVVIVRQEENY